MVLELVKSQKGKNMLVHDGSLFEKDKLGVKGLTFWKCTQARRYKCRARIHTFDNEIKKIVGFHNHVPEKAVVDSRKALTAIKKRGEETRDSGYTIVAEVASTISSASQSLLPTVDSMKRTIRRVRVKQGEYPPSPNSLNELRIPPEISLIRIDNQEENFLVYDSGINSSNRILLFSTKANLSLLSRCSHWYADGTFRTSPPLFTQLYTIHGVEFNNVIPSIFALLPDKLRSTYDLLFEAVMNLIGNIEPKSIMMDFEMAAISAFQNKFHSTTVRGCFFHLSQCLWRKIQECGKAVRYREDEEYALQIRMLTALAFLPIDDVISGFEDVIDSQFFIENEEDLREVIDYFEDVWIGRPTRGGRRRPPRYPITLWNCHNAVVEDLPRTNNAVEGWHRRFNELVGAQHPNIWKFIDCLKKEQRANNITIGHYLQGRKSPHKKKVYRDVNHRIKNCVHRYDSQNKLIFLKGIASSVNLNV